MDNPKIKNIIMKENLRTQNLPAGLEGLDIYHRPNENGESYMSITGPKQLINNYLQDKPILSDRLRTLKNIPHFRIIETKRVEIY